MLLLLKFTLGKCGGGMAPHNSGESFALYTSFLRFQVPILNYSSDGVSHETLTFEAHSQSHVSYANNENFNIPITLYTVRILRNMTKVQPLINFYKNFQLMKKQSWMYLKQKHSQENSYWKYIFKYLLTFVTVFFR